MPAGGRRERRLTRIAGTAATIVGLALPAAALDPRKSLTQYGLDHWGVDDGLPQSSVTGLAQTPDGYLWAATLEGVARFDGHRLDVFDRSTVGGLPTNAATALAVDASGRLWVGTMGGGVGRLDGRQATFWSTAEGLGSDRVWSIHHDPAGATWVGTTGGLSRLDDDTVTTLTTVDGLAGNTVRRVIDDGEGGLWIATDGGLCRLRGETLDCFTPDRGLAHPIVRSLLADPDGSLWVGTLGGGLQQLLGGVLRPPLAAPELRATFVSALAFDRDGSLWVGTRSGLHRLRQDGVASFPADDPLASQPVLTLLEDREGSLWVGTQTAGLYRLRDQRLTPVTTREGLADGYVSSVAPADPGGLWIGTVGGGVHRLADGRCRRVLEGRLPGEPVNAVLEDRGGALWVGTSGAGLARVRDGEITLFTAARGLADNVVLSLYEDRFETLWVGTNNGGLSRRERGGWRSWSGREGLPDETVFAIAEDAAGAIWLGTGGGLVRFDGERFAVWSTDEGLTNNVVVCLHPTDGGGIWAGTFGGGLNRLLDGRLARVTTQHGLFSDTVYAMIDDRAGGLWMSSNRGIFRVDLADLEAVADGTCARLACRVFGRSDGMPGRECNGGVQPAGCRLADGRIAFPTIGGVALVDPQELGPELGPPPVVTQRALVGRRVVEPLADPLVVPAGTRNLQIDYAALTFLSPERVRFRYRLEGFDADWVDAGSRRSAFYSRLPPGSYRFQVDAAREGGPWGGITADLEVVQEPFFYQTMAFLITSTLALMAIGALALHLRLRRVRGRQRELETLVEARTRELEKANRTLRGLADLDGLTGLANHRAFQESLLGQWSRAQRTGQPLALLMVDLDGFKQLNDALGHQAGDRCLRRVADAIRSELQRPFDLLARYGGDELAAILPDTDAPGALHIAERIRTAVEALAIPRSEDPAAGHMTVSVGAAATRPTRKDAPAGLIAAADAALYVAKSQGRNRAALTSDAEQTAGETRDEV